VNAGYQWRDPNRRLAARHRAPDPVPDRIISAAVRAVADSLGRGGGPRRRDDLIAIAVRAADPLIRADERAQIVALARHRAGDGLAAIVADMLEET
jgi:hypothetical protein